MARIETADWQGHDPDVLNSLANERNGLAWQRTALSWLGAGAAVVRYFSSNGLLTARTSVGYLMLMLGLFMGFDGSRRYRYHDRRIRDDEPHMVPATTIRAIGYATTLVIALIIAVELVKF